MATYFAVLDYGHGGSKPGAVYGGVEEKIVNMILGESVRRSLKDRAGDEVGVMLTRDDDYDIPLAARYGLINEHHRQRPINVVVSVHHNAAGSSQPAGFEIYYAERSRMGEHYASAIVDSIRDDGFMLRHDGLITTAQLGRRLAMIHKIVPPSILIEAGYLTNPVDRAHSIDSDHQRRLGEGIADGILNGLRSSPS